MEKSNAGKIRKIFKYLIICLACASLVAIEILYVKIYLYSSSLSAWDLLKPRCAAVQSSPIPRTSDLKDTLEQFVSENLCYLNATNRCQASFEPHHMPPFAISLTESSRRLLKKVKEHILLIIVFNRDTTYFVVPLLHVLYARHFAAVRYCGPWPNKAHFESEIAKYFPQEEAAKFGTLFTAYFPQNYAEIIKGGGETMYNCINIVLNGMNETEKQAIEGAFVMQDDAFLSFWLLAFQPQIYDLTRSFSFPVATPFSVELLKICDPPEKPVCDVNLAWGAAIANRQQLLNFFKEMDNVATSDSYVAECNDNITQRAHGSKRAYSAPSDAFYVAAKNFPHLLPVFQIAAQQSVFQEIAVPTIMTCISDKVDLDVTRIRVENTMNQKAWELFDSNILFMHPFKMSRLVNALSGNEQARSDSNRDICLYCLLVQYGKLLSSQTQQ